MKSPFSTVMLAASALFSVSAIFSVAAWADEPVSSLPEGIDFYGKINVSAQLDNDYDSVDSPAVSHKDTNFAWHSYGSRLGAKGKYTLDDDWALVYKVEYEIDANNGYGSQKDFFLAREIYAGIHSKTFGTIEGGKLDTPLRMLQGKVDLFADLTAGDMKFVMVGKNRDSHTYLYRTPSFYGVTAAFATINFREVDNGSKYYDRTGNSMSLTYVADKLLTDNDSLYFAVAHDEGVRDLDVERVAMQYKFGSHENLGVFTVGALAQNARKTAPGKKFVTGQDREDGYMLNASWAFTADDTIKIQYARSEEVEYDGALSTIGYDRRLTKALKGYIYHGEIAGDEDKVSSDRTLKSTGIGLEYSF
ncbi:MAG: porin [Pseudomonadales bacterium]|jgi:predicted porin|nr:porin [Cellvibrionales bacterium]MBP8030559.1 porin [Pseudomonadales bacterium]